MTLKERHQKGLGLLIEAGWIEEDALAQLQAWEREEHAAAPQGREKEKG